MDLLFVYLHPRQLRDTKRAWGRRHEEYRLVNAHNQLPQGSGDMIRRYGSVVGEIGLRAVCVVRSVGRQRPSTAMPLYMSYFYCIV